MAAFACLAYALFAWKSPIDISFSANDKNDLSLEVDDLSVLPEVDEVVRDLSYPDWIVLSLIHTNLTAINFNNFLQDLAFQQKNSQKWKLALK